MLKKHMSPLSKGGQLVKHAGKGSSQASMPNRSQINALAQPPAQGINNYAKATPMAGGMPPIPGGGPPPGGGGATPGGPPGPPPLGLGTGGFSGTGNV